MFFTPRHVKHGKHYVKEARKLLAYKRDLATPETIAEVEAGIEAMRKAVATADKATIEAEADRLDKLCGKLTKPLPDAGIRENVEVFLVAIVIALAVRTYFVQPFTIPTGSMQPTLNGITAHKITGPWPNAAQVAFETVFFGRTYFDKKAKEEEFIVEVREVKRFGFLTYTRIDTNRGNVYQVRAPLRVIQPEFLPDLRQAVFRKGDPIIRGYVQTGDHVFVDKFTYHFRRPERGEVFVFNTQTLMTEANRHNPGGPSQFYIKRLAGLPNDVLRIDPPVLEVNGKRAEGKAFDRVMSGTLRNPTQGYQGYSNGSAGGGRFPILGSPNVTFTVPPRNYFALGDNSYNSSDSRDWGSVPERNVAGRGFFVYWPLGPHWGFMR